MLTLIKKALRKRELKKYWKSEVDSFLNFFKKIEKTIKPEDLASAEILMFDKQFKMDAETVAEVNRICKADIKDYGFVINRDDLSLDVFYNKKQEMFLRVSIVNESWNENFTIFKVNEYPNFKFKNYTRYKDGLYYTYGGEVYNIPNWDKPIRILFPLTEDNKKKMVEELIKERVLD